VRDGQSSLVGLTIVFDLDGTLVDTAPDLMGAIDLLLAEKGLPSAPHDRLRPLISIGSRAMLARALDDLRHPVDAATFDAWWQRYLEIYAANIAVKSRPFDGLTTVLNRLTARGARLAVCTNKTEDLSKKLLGALGLLSRFHGLAGRDTFDHCQKPNPEHLRGAVRLAGGDSVSAVMVGDSDVDIAAARNAGVPVIAVSFGYVEAPIETFAPDAIIDHYSQFDTALSQVLATSAMTLPSHSSRITI
jgi:phosphoglycolate phosphatase